MVTFVATLVAPPGKQLLNPAMAQMVAKRLPKGEIAGWLSPNEAVDLSFELDLALGPDGRLDDPSWRELHRYRSLIYVSLGSDRIVDVILQPKDGRRKALFLADMDSTMIGQECIDELAAFAGLKQHVSEITERAMRGEIAFEPALRERVALLKGLPVSVVEDVLDKAITLTPGGTTLVVTMKANGAHTALVSGGFTLFTENVARRIGFHEHHSNVLVVEDDKFAGLVTEPILGREAKLASLIALRDARGLKPSQTMAVGDGANDLAMLQAAGLGVAYHAKPAVAAAAHARIEFGDLSALLFAQGYRREEFVEKARLNRRDRKQAARLRRQHQSA